jgi:NO-binding membrane sensor protein with MHYT domain
MFFKQKIFAIAASILIMFLVVELVRRRKLREEYSWLWLLTGALIVLLVVWYDLLLWITHLIGAIAPTTTLFIFGLLFLMVISLHYSIQISKLSLQVKEMAQELTLLKGRVEDSMRALDENHP